VYACHEEAQWERKQFFSFFIFAGFLVATDRNVQCKCRQVEGGEYACKCVVISGTTPSAFEFTMPVPEAGIALPAAARKVEPSTSPTANSLTTTDKPAERPAATTAGGTPMLKTTATGIPIYEGPRGGQYHYSKSGKKVYERKRR
jgi:hypothetical protein